MFLRFPTGGESAYKDRRFSFPFVVMSGLYEAGDDDENNSMNEWG